MQKMPKFGSNSFCFNLICKDKASERGESYKQTN